MQVRVLDDVCQGHTLCATSAPKLFGLSEEDGHAIVLLAEVPPELENDARRAALGCPEQAIQIF
ncbi:MAG: ferredoxin [Actinomycetia bacterium]|nr:ferredoxin [Actinomycetes bacterium]